MTTLCLRPLRSENTKTDNSGQRSADRKLHLRRDQIIAEYDGSGNLTAKYVYGSGIDEILCKTVIASPQGEASGLAARQAIYYYHSDGLGSITAITDDSGNIVERYQYDIYGNVLIKDSNGNTLAESAIGNRYFFTGREYDYETGLYYYRARYYDPKIGRFLQTDPIGYQGGINLYSYVKNNPVNWVDPYGLCPNGNKATAPFKWWDITSWAFPKANYCGWTKSGPGPTLSELDTYCKEHDERLQETGAAWWHLWDKDVQDIHGDFINSWSQDYQNRAEEENDNYPYNSDEYGYLLH